MGEWAVKFWILKEKCHLDDDQYAFDKEKDEKGKEILIIALSDTGTDPGTVVV